MIDLIFFVVEVAAEDLNLLPVSHGLAEGGEVDLVSHFVRSCNSNLGRELRHCDALDVCSMREKLKLTAQKRLEMTLRYESRLETACLLILIVH